MAKQEITPVMLGAIPPSLDEHNANMARRREESQAAQPRLLDCLDPTVAKYYEDRKDLFEWRVEVKLFRAATPKTHAQMQDFDEKVVAQNEQDAWAMFCDKVGEWPSPRDTNARRKITKLKKRTLRAEDD